MSKWRDVAAAVMAQPEAPPEPQEIFGLPSGLAASLRRLDAAAAPRIFGRSGWRPVVDDALRLASEGWAASALAFQPSESRHGRSRRHQA
jgi:hypothetical protein